MSRLEVTVSGSVQAAADRVYDAIEDIQNIPRRDQAVQKIEFLSQQKRGAGTRFRETRSMGKRTVVTELEVTEAVAGESVRFVSDAGGTIWDTVYTCRPEGSDGSSTWLEIAMEARPYKLLPKLMSRFVLPMVRKGMKQHLEELKTYCESRAEEA
ncbi:MAG: SRPBCC family protein [Thermoanaerobaculia bacterium]|nr:SRPBCC family protein [Thermoanaerobaculia bacterium]